MKLRLRRFNPWSVASLFAKVYFALAVIFALIFIPITLFAPHKPGENPVVIAIVAGVALLIFYPLAGYLGGLLMGYLYNWFSGKKGGIEMEFDAIEEEAKSGQ